MQPEIIYKDEHLIIVNKPPGVSIHGGIYVSGITLTDMLLEQFPEISNVGDEPTVRPGIVHRLDKDTSGVLAVARDQETFLTLKELFKSRQVEKRYRAIICGTPKKREGVITAPIGRLVSNPLKRGTEVGRTRIRGAREAETAYKVLKAGEHYSLLELAPKTGRMHQLRVHLKSIGHPIACDRIYGGAKVCCPSPSGRQLLHAHTLSFSMPGGKRFHFEADPPEDFEVAERMIS